MKAKLIRITTVPVSLKTLLKGQHRFMSQNGFEVLGVAANGKELQEVASYEGIKVHPIKMTRTISPIEDLLSLVRFYWLCKKYKPTIVHSHTPKAGIVGMCAAKLAGVPIRLHTVAGLPLMEAKGLKRSVLNLVEKTTYRFATKVYPNSKGLYDFIVENKFTSSKKLKVIGNGSSNGIDTSHFDPLTVSVDQITRLRSEHKINENDVIFCFVGRLVGDKGINELIQAFTEINTHNNTAKLLLVGPYEHALDPLEQSTLDAIYENPNIKAVGFQEDIRPFLAISDAFVFPSYREGFPNVVMQAGAMELPAIVTDINGCNEIIQHNHNGIIIPPKDTTALTHAMQQLIDDPTFCQSLAQNARPSITSRYEQQVVWDALLAEYQLLLSEKTGVQERT